MHDLAPRSSWKDNHADGEKLARKVTRTAQYLWNCDTSTASDLNPNARIIYGDRDTHAEVAAKFSWRRALENACKAAENNTVSAPISMSFRMLWPLTIYSTEDGPSSMLTAVIVSTTLINTSMRCLLRKRRLGLSLIRRCSGEVKMLWHDQQNGNY